MVELIVVHERIIRKMENAVAGMIHLHHSGGDVEVIVEIVSYFYTPGCWDEGEWVIDLNGAWPRERSIMRTQPTRCGR